MKKLFLCMLFVLFSVPLFCQSNVRNIYVGEEISLTFTAGLPLDAASGNRCLLKTVSGKAAASATDGEGSPRYWQ